MRVKFLVSNQQPDTSMVRSFLILTLLNVVLSQPLNGGSDKETDASERLPYKFGDLCIPQGNECKEDFQCCKGFHCEAPIYKDQKHCIADQEKLEHKSEEESYDYKLVRVPVRQKGKTMKYKMSPMSFVDNGVVIPHPSTIPPPPQTEQPPSPAKDMMMKLIEAALRKLTNGKPIRMRVTVNNPEVLLDGIADSNLVIDDIEKPTLKRPTDSVATESVDDAIRKQLQGFRAWNPVTERTNPTTPWAGEVVSVHCPNGDCSAIGRPTDYVDEDIKRQLLNPV